MNNIRSTVGNGFASGVVPASKIGTSVPKLVMLVMTACFVFAGESRARTSATPQPSRSFGGVTAAFRIANPVVKVGNDLKITVVYRNVGTKTVHFRFFHLDENAALYKRGESKPIVGGFAGEPAFLEKTLRPGEAYRFDDTFTLKGWPDLKPGRYEIRFAYYLGLLSDECSIKEYKAEYSVDGYVVPWTEQRYGFTLVK